MKPDSGRHTGSCTLADAKVNVLALLGSTAGARGSAQVMVDNVNNAKKALGAAGLSYTEGMLEHIELANKPGALAELAGRLAKKGINIDCAYATMPKGAKKAVGIPHARPSPAWR